MTHYHQSSLRSVVVAAFLMLLVSLDAQNFDCANERQVLSFCALTNQSDTSLTSCISCVYPEFPSEAT